MKTALIALLISFSAMAETTCFTRSTEIETSEITLGRTLCFGDVEVQVDMLSAHKAILRYSIDENRNFKTVDLKNGVARGDGTVVYQVNIESNESGGYCGDTWSATSMATIVIKRNGTMPIIESLEGEIGYSSDNCHSSMRSVQKLQYTLI